MAAKQGRLILLKVLISGSYVSIGGLRAKSVKIGEGQTEVTDSDSPARMREILAGAGIIAIDVSGSGVFKESAAEKYMTQQKLAGVQPSMQVTVPGLGTFQGPFQIGDLDYAGNHDGEVTYNMAFASAAEVTFTPA